ncbi:hypothetical protein P7C70_g7817, partial [Phenoliferia sp. Uapishka_3]
MVTCTRRGCGQDFDPAKDTNEGECTFHPGWPVFHEGLKSWSCCDKINRGPPDFLTRARCTPNGHDPALKLAAVTSFDEFLALKGCTTGSHSLEKEAAPVKAEAAVAAPSLDADGKEVYGGVAAPKPTTSTLPPLPPAPTQPLPSESAKPVSTEYVEEQDQPGVLPLKGATCKRRGCGVSWDGESRDGEECRYHPGGPIFHEASKGFSCCKHRTLDFDEFMAIKGCRTGKHLFVGAKQEEKVGGELVECRVDHYQTPREVHVSVFGKGADKEKSKVVFEAEAMHVELLLPASKRFQKTFSLYGPINPETSTFKILGTKCEIILQKADARSWPSVTSLDASLAKNFTASMVFSAGGGRGTTGAKDMVLDEANKARG